VSTGKTKGRGTPRRFADRYVLTPQLMAELKDFKNYRQSRIRQSAYIPPYDYDYYEYPRDNEYATRYYDGIRYDIRTNRRRYYHGEHIPVIFSYCNLSERPKTFSYSDGRRVNFSIIHHGREIRHWTDNDYADYRGGDFVLQPGECRTYTTHWDLRDHRGYFVDYGPHIIRAYDRSDRRRYVEANVEVFGSEYGPAKYLPPCSRSNMLHNPGFEDWFDRNVPEKWSAVNVKRSRVAHTDFYAAELGDNPDRRALLSQSIPAQANRIYEVTFWASENTNRGGKSDFILEAAIFVYNDLGQRIGRVDPVYKPNSLPNGTYQQYTFTTGTLPYGTNWLELRFEFRPSTGNVSTVLVDDVSLRCL